MKKLSLATTIGILLLALTIWLQDKHGLEESSKFSAKGCVICFK